MNRGSPREAPAEASGAVDPKYHDAVLFDMDGVVTDTARLHATCWKEVFDPLLARRGIGAASRPFDPDRDYREHVDGKPRRDGIRDFLASRGIELPEGGPEGADDEETVAAIAQRKDALVDAHLASGDVRAWPDAEPAIRRVREAGLRTALVSASHHAEEVLEAVGLAPLFEVRVDGWVADDLGMAGKPAPDAYLEAARRLGVPPERCVVLEDARAGVRAGRAGGFALVVGVARHGDEEALMAAGAHRVVTRLEEIFA